MKTLYDVIRILILALLFQAAVVRTYADDTCTFMTTANDIPPNIVILLDNGAAMEEIVWHFGYNNSINYTPNPATNLDIVENSVGNGFYREKGYSVIKQGNDYYLVEIPDDLVVANHQFSRKADGTGNSPIWTINGRAITLPVAPSKSEVYGVIDNATNFRYPKNYLNWLFYYNYSSDTPGILAYDGSALPDKTRFYYAKKSLITIAKMAANKASLSIYNFTANASGATNATSCVLTPTGKS
jgi:hypothetical protein